MKRVIVLLLLSVASYAGLCAAERGNYYVDFSPVNSDSIIAEAPAYASFAQYHLNYLLDKYDVQLNPDFTTVSTEYQIYQLTSSEGVQAYGTYVLGYRVGYDSVFIHIARSRAADGTVHEVPPDQIMYDISPSNLMENDLYTDRRQVRINFPGLAEGSILEIKFTRKQYRTDLAAFSGFFAFQLTCPSAHSVLSLKYPTNVELHTKSYDFDVAPKEVKDGGYITKTWITSAQSALPAEPGSLSNGDLGSRVDYATAGSWQEYGNAVRQEFWAKDFQTPLSDCEKRFLDTLDLKALSPLERARRIYRSVQAGFRYLGLEMGVNNLKPHESALICTKRYGDCKDLANLLIKLLRSQGIQAEPALLATVDNIFFVDQDFPCAVRQNHCIVLAPGLEGHDYWLDPTLNLAPFGWLHPFSRNTTALILGEPEASLAKIPVSDVVSDSQGQSISITLDSSGAASVSQRVAIAGLSGVGIKEQLRQLNPDEKDNWVKAAIASGKQIEDIHYEIQNLDNNDSAFVLICSYHDADFAQVAGKLILIKAIAERPSKQFDNSDNLATRVTGLFNVYTPRYSKNYEINFPDGYRIKYLPPPLEMDNKFFQFTRKIDESADHRVSGATLLQVKVPYITAEEYSDYHKSINAMDSAMDDAAILERAD